VLLRSFASPSRKSTITLRPFSPVLGKMGNG
jgi:hypothetical protein